MRHEVRILEMSDGWYFQVLSYNEDKVVNNLLLHHETLIEAITTADTLSLHIENLEDLPLTQYKCAG